MTGTDLESVRAALIAKQQELSGRSRNLESIAVQRSPDAIEELQYKSGRELAILHLNRDSVIFRHVELALIRIKEGIFGTCLHCEQQINQRRP